jgi:hypothetical protein
LKFFEELGTLIEGRWRDQNYNEAAFAELAAAALEELPPHPQVNMDGIIRWLHRTPQLPRQMDVDGHFGDPPITLFAGPRFHIDIYFWLDGTTSIHQHSFSGAFQVLLGSSIHSRYDFKEDGQINEHLCIGQVKLAGVELLQVGATRKVLSGRRFIHSLFHLDRPSATITVRTNEDIQAKPQWDYLKPYLARDPFFREESLSKRLQSVTLLLSMKHPQADSFIAELLAAADFQTSFAILDLTQKHFASDALQQVFGLGRDQERFAAFFAVARKRHGQLAELLPPVFAEQQRQESIVNRRRFLADPELRFFLALLLNVPDKSLILELVKARFPERPALETMGDWLMELASTRALGSREANLLGIEDFDEADLFVFGQLLQGFSTEQIRQAIGREFAPEDADELQSELENLIQRLRRATLFQAILGN